MVMVTFVLGGAACSQMPGRDEPDGNSRYGALIDALANQNTPPKLIQLGRSTIPLFAPEYNWREDGRVRDALDPICENDSEALWEEMVLRVGDGRYSLTMGMNGASPRNYTVGMLCETIAYQRLCTVFDEHLTVDDSGGPINFDAGIDDLTPWRKEFAMKPLFELQIKVCEHAIKSLNEVAVISQQKRAELKDGLQSEIAKLKRSRRAILGPYSMDGFDFFDAGAAARFREQWRLHQIK